MESISKSLGRTLLNRRHDLKLSQSAVAELSGKDQAQIAHLEKGLSDPRLSSVVQVGRALGLELVLVPVKLLPTVRTMIDGRILSQAVSATRFVGNDPEDEWADDE